MHDAVALAVGARVESATGTGTATAAGAEVETGNGTLIATGADPVVPALAWSYR